MFCRECCGPETELSRPTGHDEPPHFPSVIGGPGSDFINHVCGTVLLAAARNVSGAATARVLPRSDLGENAFPHLDPRRRKRIVIGVDCVAEQPSECVGFLIGIG
jgi:hypothetical protein